MEYRVIKYKKIIFTITEIDKIEFTDFYLALKKFGLINEVSKMSYHRGREFIYGRICVRNLLNKLGYENIHVPALNTDRTPKWPFGIIGSISHTNKMIAVYVSSTSYYSVVGIDIEIIMNKQQSNAVMELIFNESEFFKNRPKSMLHYSNELYSTIVFSAKESIFKAIYQCSGCYFDFKDICLVGFNGELNFKIISTINEKWFSDKIINVFFDVFDETVLTLVLENK